MDNSVGYMTFETELFIREFCVFVIQPTELSIIRKFSPLSAQGLEPQFGHPPMAPPEPVHHLSAPLPDAELRVISAKLDTVKALLEVINQRLDRIDGKKSEDLV